MTLFEAFPELKAGKEIQRIDTGDHGFVWVYCLKLSGIFFKEKVYRFGSAESKKGAQYHSAELTSTYFEFDWEVVE